jgi:hypothetical protein
MPILFFIFSFSFAILLIKISLRVTRMSVLVGQFFGPGKGRLMLPVASFHATGLKTSLEEILVAYCN